MALTFYYGSGSPFSWRVFLALEHKALAYEPRLLSFSEGDHKKPEYLKINPRHRVPAITDDDFSLYESNAIMIYLDERFPDAPALFPGDIRQRALVHRRVSEADSYVGLHNEALVGELFFKRDPATRNAGVIERAKRNLIAELERLESGFEADFLAGAPSAADFTLYPFLATFARFELRDSGLGLVSSVGPKTRAWMQRIESLPYFEKTYPQHWKA